MKISPTQLSQLIKEVALEEKKKSQKMPPGYKAKKGTARGKRLRQLTKQYQDAKKTPGKADDMAAIKARDAYEKTQKKSSLR